MATRIIASRVDTPTPHHGGTRSQADYARAARDVLTSTRATLQVWITAVRRCGGIQESTARTLRESMDAIDLSMQEAEDACSNVEYGAEASDFWEARSLLRIISFSLQIDSDDETPALEGSDLAEAADLALDRLTTLDRLLLGVAGGAR